MDIVEELNAGQPATAEATPEAAPAPAAEAPPLAEAPEETAAQTEARERDEKGRFKPKAEDQTMVPLTALHETRDKVRNLEAELEKLRTPAQAPQAVPDVFEDPQGFAEYQSRQVQTAVLNTTLNLSEEMTRQSAGDDVVNEAQQWGQAEFVKNPGLYQQFISQRNPYGFLVGEYKRSSAIAKLGADPSQIDEFLAWKAGQAAPVPPPAPSPAIPSSLAAEQSSRGEATQYQPPSLDEILRGKP